jgi:DNA-binding XRE family transcriptional regulator
MGQRPRTLQPYASPDAYFGAQLREWRTRAGLSQTDLGHLIHISGDLVGKIEKAQRRAHPQLVADFDTALAAGGALAKCAPAPDESNGRPPLGMNVAGVRDPASATRRSTSAALKMLDEAVAARYRGSRPPTIHAMSTHPTLTQVWGSYQAARFTDAATAAATVIPSLQAAAQDPAADTDRRTNYRALAMGYHATAATATKLGATDLAWICADRGLNAAEASEDPAVVASLLRSVAHVLLSTNRCAEAADVADRAALQAASHLRPGPTRCSLLGSLHLVAAMASARAGDRTTARSHLAEAARLAALLGHDANHAWTAFGPTNVAVHDLSVHVEMGDLSAASKATPLAPRCLLPRERRIRHDLEVARVWSAIGRVDDAVNLVLAARRHAPDQVRHHFLTQDLVTAWLQRPLANRSDIQDLARDLYPDEPSREQHTSPKPRRQPYRDRPRTPVQEDPAHGPSPRRRGPADPQCDWADPYGQADL